MDSISGFQVVSPEHDPYDPNTLLSSGLPTLDVFDINYDLFPVSSSEPKVDPLAIEEPGEYGLIAPNTLNNLKLGYAQEITFILAANDQPVDSKTSTTSITTDFITGLPADIEVIENYRNFSAVALRIESVDQLNHILKNPDILNLVPYDSGASTGLMTAESDSRSRPENPRSENTNDSRSSDSQTSNNDSQTSNNEIVIDSEILSAIADKISLTALDALIDGEAQELLISFNSRDIEQAVEEKMELENWSVGSDEVINYQASLFSELKDDILSPFSQDLEILDDYENLPITFAKFDQVDPLIELLQNPYILGVDVPQIHEKALAESLPLIGQPRAIEATGFTGSGTTVAVLDTGADPNAPGLQGRIVYARDFAPDDGQDDDDGHGTNVSAIVAGVAPGTQIAALDVFDWDLLAYDSDIIAAINWSIQNRNTYNIAAINMSLGGSAKYTSPRSDNATGLGQAIANARNNGILPIVSSGNDGFTDGISSPAAFESAISVGSVYDFTGTYGWDSASPDRVSSFSNSSPFLDILAPGSEITAGGLSNYSGTSMAAPHVAGAIAVLREAFPNESSEQLLQRLINSGDPITDHRNNITKNRINLASALQVESSRPDNDNFGQAAVLSGTSITVTGSNIGATQQSGEPNHAGTGGSSVWWTWTAPISGEVTINTFGSNFDTVLAAYTGSSVSNLNTIASNDDSGGGRQSEIIFDAIAGTSYYIAVDGYQGATGNITLDLSLATASPANDNLANSIALSGASVSTTGTNINATQQSGEPSHAGTGGSSVWWNWTAPSSGTATINTNGSDFDTVLGVYTGSSISGLTEIASDDNSGFGLQSQVTFNAVGGTNYKIAVDGFNGAQGNINLDLVFATSQLPNDDFSSSATLSGTSVNITSSNVNATKEPGEPNHAGLYGGSSVWWNWTAPDSGLVTIDTFGSNFDTILAAYTGSSLSNLTEIDSNDDTNGLQSQISFVVEPGTTYKIAVDGFGGASGDINLSLLLETSLLSNDDFANSTSLGGSYASVTSSNIGATKQPGEPNHAGNSGGSSLWWNWTAPGSGNVAINTGGSDFDTTLAAYTGSSISNLTEVASNDDSLWYGRQSEIIFDVIGGTNYNIAVDGYNGASGNINLELIYSETQGNNVDLIPGNFTLNTTQSNPGDSIQVTYSIMNTGSDDADSSEGGFWVDFYLSDDSSIDPGEDYLLGWTWVDPIPGNSSTGTLTKQISLPNTSDSFWSGDGEYTIGLIVDPFGFVIETNESNNTAVRNITIGTSTEQPYTSVPITINGTYEGIIGDFNGDGISDVLWYVPGPGQDYIWFFDEDGNYESQPFTVNGTYTPIPGDFNGSGISDILWYAPGLAPDYIWYFNEDGDYESRPFTVNGVYTPIPGDFNGSGISDILWYAPGLAPDYIWYFNEDGDYESRPFTVNGDYIPVQGDFNGSGITDILWYAPGTAPDYIWSFNEDGTYESRPFTVNGYYIPVQGDFNGSGLTDILWYRPGPGQDYIWSFNEDGTYDSRPFTVNGDYIPLQGDFNGSGLTDILWYRPGPGQDYIWYFR
ncbi:MAG: S8 family serine peptidase [Limnospira sp. PMC 1291.21]|uniref:S8 family serine peptidase n=2 Tax=Limnospira TaxID=2596745 RepID=UPI0028E11D85|nr:MULTISPECIES: S8 family serine peptidase [unclassified Limnospira]MDT9177007.1 S8 family serine peptidase [Limnospira sp. PMC 1238.20]MDT9202563.1 S8 family serine peptidase [Limnospira sp. PMC 1243.20]MDT9207712.1 S8 family serine peptidase [Limnospira sp. PMC 1252.20]MDT9212334.1 S8 family serine peptidase [Limnospira sp. PMC 1256.20]MDT9217935.1 S8 family serine peptidase [Limnospira sp. PMC 1240.20]